MSHGWMSHQLPSSLRHAAAVRDAGYAEAAASAVPLADRGRLVTRELPATLGIHGVRATQDGLLWEVVVTRELVHERIRARQIVRKNVPALRAGQLVDRFAGG